VTDDRLERELRQFFVARDPGPVPASVHDAVRAVPDTTPAPGIGGFFGRALLPLAAAAVLVVLVAVLAEIRLAPFDGAGATPSPSTLPGTLQPGDGTIPVEPPLAIAAAVIAILVGLVIVAMRAGPGTRRRTAIAAGVVIVGASLWVANFDALSGPVSSATGSAPITDPNDGSDIFAVGPNTTIPIGVWVQNSTGLPITIVGLAQDRVATVSPTLPGPVAIGRFADPGVIDPRQPLPFAPIRLQPRETTSLAFLIATGECGASTNTENYVEVAQLLVAYEVLGITKVANLFMVSPIRIPLVAGCGS
jgi:hypothetical protein